MKTRKKVAHWTDGETVVLPDFLARELSKARNGKNFKKTTWMEAASHIALKFPVMKGAPKDTEACERRFQLIRDQYFTIVTLKNASSFTYLDKDGTGITLTQSDVWNRYIKSHKYVKPFRSEGFIHFDSVTHFIPDTSKGKFVYWAPMDTGQSSSALNLDQLSTATNETAGTSDQQLVASQHFTSSTSPPLPSNPNAMLLATPSAFLSQPSTSPSGSTMISNVS
ncbi:hypothetical protein J3R83DRAFT_8841 [Lanmaoa asiatica]|nr:hypothetical protein J3R83DRAFT_8841 [Lanmaoa asiatica]